MSKAHQSRFSLGQPFAILLRFLVKKIKCARRPMYRDMFFEVKIRETLKDLSCYLWIGRVIVHVYKVRFLYDFHSKTACQFANGARYSHIVLRSLDSCLQAKS